MLLNMDKGMSSMEIFNTFIIIISSGFILKVIVNFNDKNQQANISVKHLAT
jgi:hypothetical protein